MVLEKCRYSVDCIFCRRYDKIDMCIILSDTRFDYPCPFYKSSKDWCWDNVNQEWKEKDGYK